MFGLAKDDLLELRDEVKGYEVRPAVALNADFIRKSPMLRLTHSCATATAAVVCC